MNRTGLSGRTNGVKLYVNDYTDWDFRIWPFAVLTGFFFVMKCMSVSPGQKKWP